MSLACALAARALGAGAWLAAVGVPMLGIESASELGVPVDRLVMVDATGVDDWAERLAAAADGFEVLLTRAPPGANRAIRKLRTRLHARGAVLLVVGLHPPDVSCDIEFSTGSVSWAGIGDGHGRLRSRRVVVRAGGRRIPRPVERDLLLPGPSGRAEPIEPVAVDDRLTSPVIFERAG